MFCNTALSDWRKKRNFTRSHMAKLLDLSSGHYGYLEKGLRQPSTKVIAKLLELTGMSSDVFFPTNKSDIKTNPLKIQLHFLEAQQENFNLRNTIFSKEVEIVNANSLIYILDEIMNVATNAIRKKYSLDRYKSEIINIAKDAVQKMDIPCDVVCRAFGISFYTLKTWIGQDKLLFKCPFNLFQPIYEFTPERAGENFRCIDCDYLQRRICKGYGISAQHSIMGNDINIFDIIKDLIKKGITERSEHIRILEERYNFRTTESTLNEYIRRYEKGENVPDSFKYMLGAD